MKKVCVIFALFILSLLPQVARADVCCQGLTNPIPIYRSTGCHTDENVVDASRCAQTGQLTTEQVQAAIDKSDTTKGNFFLKLNFGIPGSKFIAGKNITLTGATLGEYISAFYVFFTGLAGIMAVAMMVYGGFQYVASSGNSGRMSNARDTITSAVSGLVLALGAYTILLFVNPNLVKFDGIKLTSVTTILQGLEGSMQSEKGVPAASWSGNNIPTYDTEILAAANAAGLSQVNNEGRNRLKALMFIESSGDPNAVSGAGACGLVQLLPSTAKNVSDNHSLGYTDFSCDKTNSPGVGLLNPAENTMIAAWYYRDLLEKTCPISTLENPTVYYKNGSAAICGASDCTDGNPRYANAAYNGGLGANCSSKDCAGQTWWECSSNPGYDETRKYVDKAETAYQAILRNRW